MKTVSAFQIPRNSLTLLLVAHVAAVIPHIPRLPIWLVATVIVCIVWRIMIYRGQWPLPNKLLRFSLVLLAIVGIVWEYGTFNGIGPGVSLLILTYTLKLLEMRQKRDAYFVVILGYFVIATEFFFNQGIPITIYQFLVFTLITAALMGLNQTVTHRNPKRTLKVASILVLQCVPIMIVFFVFFPRIQPLWSLDLSSDRASTGISDTMSPGDIAELSQSGALAFRVNFNDGVVPENESLYWRGVVMSYYDGRTWSEATRPIAASDSVNWSDKPTPKWDKLIVRKGNESKYTVVMEPTDQRWLFALDTPVSDTPSVGLARDYRLIRDTPVSQMFLYEVTSYLDHNIGFFLEPWLRQQNIQLPNVGNSKARALAEQLLAQAKGDTQEYIRLVLEWFRQRPFIYTLKPPKLGSNSIDEFLFETQTGFCAHYSSAFAYLMRAANIPARIISGYQGGERNPVGNYLLVHQFDAHAWNEVWIEKRGWVRADPTALVSPERIESGIEEALRERNELSDQNAFSSLRYRDFPLLNTIRFSIDYMNFSWNKFVLGYDAKLQLDFLQELIGKATPQRLAIIMMSLVAVFFGLIALFLLTGNKSKSKDKINQMILSLLGGLEKLGLVKRTSETPSQFIARIQKDHNEALSPAQLQSITQLIIQYEALQFRPSTSSREADVEKFKRSVRAARKQLTGTILKNKFNQA